MTDFVMYFLFSFLEFASLMFVIFALFTFDWRHYKKEMLFTAISLSLVSYLFINFKIEQWLLPVEILMLVLIFKIGFKERSWLYSLWIVISGLLTYLLIQSAILLISVQSDLLTQADTTQPFGYKTYLLQILTASVATIIAFYIKLTRQGYGFTFRTKFSKQLYVTVGLIAVIVLSSVFYLFNTLSNSTIFYTALSCILLVCSVLLIYSHKKDNEEFSFT